MRRYIIPVLVGMLALTACNKPATTSSQTETPTQETPAVGITTGCRYTDIQALQNDGTPLALSDLVGRTDYVLVDFWASWCPPCRKSLPILKEIYLAQPAGRLEILGVSCDEDPAAWQQAVQEEGLPWRQVRDGGQAPYNPADTYRIRYIPTTILIDNQGLIVAVNLEEEQLKNLLSK